MLEILEGDEPVDAVDAFVHSISVDVGNRAVFRQNILEVICKSIECTRSTPVVFRKLIKDESGKDNGSIEIYEGEEVIDAVVRFIRKSKMSLDEISLKNYMLQEACKSSYRVKCTRNVGIVYSQTVNDEDGLPIPNKLTIYENEEPADKVYRWCQENDVVYGFPGIISSVCESSDLVVCNRRKAAYFSIPISGPEGGYVNVLELKVGNEPVDDIHSFFASNGLFKKGWDFHSLASQICAKPNVDCRRLRAVKHFDSNFTMGDVNMGQLVIWQDEEVVDVLYNLRQNYNLTLDDQIVSHNEICANEDVNCDRTRAVIFQKTGSELLLFVVLLLYCLFACHQYSAPLSSCLNIHIVTKLDYERFGNETCNRQFAGVKFRSTFVDLPFGGKMAEFLKEETVKSKIEHPFFCVWILVALLVGVHMSFTCVPRLKGRVKTSQKLVISLWLVFLVAILQTLLIEPDTQVDQAMHTFEGKLPDLVVIEDEEPVDALLRWGKIAAKEHLDENWTPIVREPIYYEILDELCNQTESLTCTRTRAWEFLNMGAMAFSGNDYPVDYYNPDVHPSARSECVSTLR